MAWKAYVDLVQDNPVPNDTFSVNIRFDDGSTSFVKTYNHHAGISKDEAKTIWLDDLDRLNALAPVKTALKALEGQEITRGAK